MRTTIILCLLFCSFAFAQTKVSDKKPQKKEKMDEGDRQLLRRDTCRKPIEALSTKYPDVSKKKLEKMQQECGF